MNLTPNALREVAKWLDVYDRLAEVYFDMLEAGGLATPEDTAKARAAVQGKEVQEDLLRWADELENDERNA